MINVLSFCLYGRNATYIIGMKENILLGNKFFPEWEIRIYYNDTVPEKYIEEYKKMKANCILCKNIGLNKMNWEGMFWRWFPLDDENVECWISRDADSRLSEREANIVKEWSQSGKTLHCIRDHRCHFNPIMGGLFGVNNKSFHSKYKFEKITDIISNLYKYYKERPYNVDQIFLNDKLWSLLKNDVMSHISNGGRRIYDSDIQFPNAHQFIGKQYRLTDFHENIIKKLNKNKGCYWKKSNSSSIYWSNSSTNIKQDVDFKNEGEYYIHRVENGFPQNWSQIHTLDGIDEIEEGVKSTIHDEIEISSVPSESESKKGVYWKTSNSGNIYWSKSSDIIKNDVQFKDENEYYTHRAENGFPQNWSQIRTLDGTEQEEVELKTEKEVELQINKGIYFKTSHVDNNVYWSKYANKVKKDVKFESVEDYFAHRVENGFPQNWSDIYILDGYKFDGTEKGIASTTKNSLGRLGNMIFRNIVINIIAKKHNLLVDYDHYDIISNIGIKLFIGEKYYLDRKVIHENNYFDIYNESILNYSIQTPRWGFFQKSEFSKLTFEYLNTVESRENFIENNPHKDRYKNNNDCFIHIRLGDLEKWNPGFNYFDSILSKLDLTNIYIATDNNNHSIIKQLKIKYPNIELLDNDLKNIIQFGSTCKHVIITQGTFSAIIGYLSFYSIVYCIKYNEKNIYSAESGADLQNGMYTDNGKWIEVDVNENEETMSTIENDEWIKKYKNKIFKIKSLSFDKYLDYYTISNNNIITLNDFVDNDSQLWKFDEYSQIINISNNKYLDFNLFYQLTLTDNEETKWSYDKNGLLIEHLNNQAIEIRLNKNKELWVNKKADSDNQKWKLILNDTNEELPFSLTNNTIKTEIKLSISNYYNEYNNNIDFLNYRTGDTICLPQYVREIPKNSFGDNYCKTKNKENFVDKSNIDYETLYNICFNSKYRECPKNSMVFHLRLFDWFSWHMADVVSITDYERFIEENKSILKNLDNIFLLYGASIKKNINETQDFLNKLINILKKYNNNIYLLNSNNCDQDFKYAITAEHYVPSIGGYSGLTGALNKNNVYWEISNKYINTYKNQKDIDDLNCFIAYQLKFKNESKYLILQYDNRDLNDDYKSLSKINSEYCKKHNYEYIFMNEEFDLPPWWIKVFIVNKYLQTNKYKGVLWLDTDACIFDDKIKLDNYDIFSKEKSFFMSGDRKGWGTSIFNAGVFFVLNNETGKNIIKDWMSSYDKNVWYKDSDNNYKTDCKWSHPPAYEQGCFINKIFPVYEKHIHKFDWTYLQSFHNDLNTNDNVFTFHFVYPLRSHIPEYLQSKKNINEYFDQIYVIHLNELVDRKKSIIDQVKKFNLKNVTIIDAINKNKIDIEELKHKELVAYGGNNYCKTSIINSRGDKCWCGGRGHDDVCNYLGRVACAFSHGLVYKDIIKNNYEKCLILEDDFVFNDNLNDLFNKLYEDIPSNWELMYFSNSSRIPRANPEKYNNSFMKMKTGVSEACCYGVTYNTAKKLSENLLPIRAAADGFLKVAIDKLFLINNVYIYKKNLSVNGTLKNIFTTSNDNVVIDSKIDSNILSLNETLKNTVNCYNIIKNHKNFVENLKVVNQENPLVSIAISTYESGGKGHELLKHNLDQILKQDYDNIEIVISDHSSDNKIKELCEDYDDKKYKITYIHNPLHKGNSSQNTNNAIAHCKGDYIKILFMDDYLYNESAISIIVNKMQETPDKKWLVHSYKHTKNYKDFYNLHHPKLSHDIALCNKIGCPSCLTIDASVKERFDEKLKWYMDSEFYKRLYDKYSDPIFIHTKDDEMPYMINLHHANQVTNTSINNDLVNKEKCYIKNKLLNII
tara:strand:- start:15476 stop:20974 length:5499 start_codon:yes stop_codon:yes gene_type:complete